ncbi:hypothetical protein EYF80_022540 [Liparis tanakae]|uniref:Uncharacterized protein n=1 Tax=Liparis tanakae TaxID=230148 RepID=A0A4Z2HQZ5_9TELE|nr:hypothetical protein EYF80_022540 [Liparis tanakae]
MIPADLMLILRPLTNRRAAALSSAVGSSPSGCWWS